MWRHAVAGGREERRGGGSTPCGKDCAVAEERIARRECEREVWTKEKGKEPAVVTRAAGRGEKCDGAREEAPLLLLLRNSTLRPTCPQQIVTGVPGIPIRRGIAVCYSGGGRSRAGEEIAPAPASGAAAAAALGGVEGEDAVAVLVEAEGGRKGC